MNPYVSISSQRFDKMSLNIWNFLKTFENNVTQLFPSTVQVKCSCFHDLSISFCSASNISNRQGCLRRLFSLPVRSFSHFHHECLRNLFKSLNSPFRASCPSSELSVTWLNHYKPLVVSLHSLVHSIVLRWLYLASHPSCFVDLIHLFSRLFSQRFSRIFSRYWILFDITCICSVTLAEICSIALSSFLYVSLITCSSILPVTCWNRLLSYPNTIQHSPVHSVVLALD